MNLRLTAATTAAIALSFAPAASAKVQSAPAGVSVCNTASQNWQGGDLSVTDDPQGYVHFDDNLRPKTNPGKGLYNAALHSHALAVCGPADDGSGSSSEDDPGDTGAGGGGLV